MDALAKKNAFQTTCKQKNWKQQGIFQKQVKECVVASYIPKIKILKNENGKIIGLKSIWKGIRKELAYQHLDFTIWQFGSHTQKQLNVIYEDLAKQIWYDPPLKPNVLKTHMIEHFSSYWRTLRSEKQKGQCMS